MTSQTITTAFVHKDETGPKIVAKGGGKQRTIPYDHAATQDRNHGLAAGAVALLLGWDARPVDLSHDVLNDGRHRFTAVS
jgi:hypothetical protein